MSAEWTNGRRFIGALALAVALAFAALGCGGTIIDADKTEEAIKANVERSLHEEVATVECPSHQKVEAGATFICRIEFSNGKHATSTWKIRSQEADISLIGFKQTR